MAERLGFHLLNIQPVPAFFKNVPGNHVPNRTARAYWAPSLPYIYSIDPQGFRSNGTTQGNDSGQDVLCLGDSYTFGISVNDTETFPAILGSLLQGSDVFRGVKVVNAGSAGAGIEDHLLYYLDKGRSIKKKLVVLQFNLFDIDFLKRGHAYKSKAVAREYVRVKDDLLFNEMATAVFKRLNQIPWYHHIEKYISNPSPTSQLADPAVAWLGYKPLELSEEAKALLSDRNAMADESRIDTISTVWRRYLDIVKRIHRAALDDGADFLLVIVPDVTQIYTYANAPSAVIPAFCELNGIKYIDLTPMFRSMHMNHGEAPFFDPEDFHCNPLGNSAIAASVLARMRKDADGILSFSRNGPYLRYDSPVGVAITVEENGVLTFPANDVVELVHGAGQNLIVTPEAGGDVKLMGARLSVAANARLRLVFKAKQPLEKVAAVFYPHLRDDDRVSNVVEVELRSGGAASRFSTSQSRKARAWTTMENEAALECPMKPTDQEFEVNLAFLGRSGILSEDAHESTPRRFELYLYPVKPRLGPDWVQ
ncbi:SGNH/GDSL hydrolase family protein [Fundidesulfovibrio soli]|uniref:SGNH/GDSL hydrolase family protein n=1 Tax=Fundidesulfovibrio soli TaxID=2922716 RepID=UPI001FAF3A3C